MARPVTNSGRRLHVEFFGDEYAEIFIELRARYGMSRADAVKRALSLYKRALEGELVINGERVVLL